MTNEEIIQKLSDMQTILMERGWGKVDLEDPKTGKVCLLGARNIVMGRSNDIPQEWVEEGPDPYVHDEVSDALVAHILSTYNIQPFQPSSINPAAPVYIWNDCFAESFNDVLDLIDATIIKQKEQM